MRLVYIDGERFAPEAARVSVYDRGFLYGDSVFETIRTYAGRLFALEEHMERLAESAAKIYIDLPVPLAQIQEETLAAVEAAGNDESYCRIMLTRGTGPVGLDTSLAEGPCRVTFVQPLRMPPEAHYREGVTAACVETVRASDAADNAKLGNYLASLLALRKARDAGADEALILSQGRLVEGTTSNLFVVRGAQLLTPPLTAGILAGITRREVIAAARDEGLEVLEEALPPDEVVAADECFHTSSIRELVPIVAIDGRPVGEGKPGPTTRRLHRAFRRRVGLERLPYDIS